jgi:hypothetical protein
MKTKERHDGLRMRWQEISIDHVNTSAAGEPARADDRAADEPVGAARQRARACYTDCLVGTAVFAARRRHRAQASLMDNHHRQELLDLYAAAALQGILAGTQGTSSIDTSNPIVVAKAAWEYARQMLAHRDED